MAGPQRTLLQRLTRVVKHRSFDETDTARALGSAALARLEERVRSGEMHHSGEIRVCVEAGLPLSYLWKDATPRERALTMFGKLRVWDTEHNNGVLIYLLLAEHSIEIVADRGLTRLVPQAEWQAMVATMRDAFRSGNFEAGLLHATEQVDALLLRHFPMAEGVRNANELPDAVYLR